MTLSWWPCHKIVSVTFTFTFYILHYYTIYNIYNSQICQINGDSEAPYDPSYDPTSEQLSENMSVLFIY